MKKKLLIAPNAFKECADSVESANLIKGCFLENNFKFIAMPLTDGGDGFLKVCRDKFNTETLAITIPALFSLGSVAVPVEVSENGDVIYVESAKVVGLNLIPINDRNPAEINTAGLGIMLKHIAENLKAVKKVVIGVGGTATNDFGIGVAAIFGLKLFDNEKNELDPLPANYMHVKKIEYPPAKIPFEIEAVVDVDNNLLGSRGATKMFAKQKGAGDKDIKIMEKGFENICDLLVRDGVITSPDKLNGAGGGLAAGLQVFFNAGLIYSEDFILNYIGIRDVPPENTIVITGEGRFDRQSLMKKAPGVIVNYFGNTASKVFIICGSAEEGIKDEIPGNIEVIEMIKYFSSPEESIKNFKKGIELACEEIKRKI
jgi:glycerate 2-kinase